MNVQQKVQGVRTLRKLKSSWICPSCSLARSRRSISTDEGSTDGTGLRIRRTTLGNDSTRRLRFNKIESVPAVVFSLIQPTGVPHLGNYLGAIRRWKELEAGAPPGDKSDTELYFGLADLHSLTSNQSSLQRRQNVKETFASLLALGLGTNTGHEADLFVQSQVSAHAELMWILSTITSTGNLSRMVQWKDKSGLHAEITSDKVNDYPTKQDSTERLKLGLFSYPVLQAADILLYGSTHVPVGEDQAQHVELTRTLARSFNRTFNSKIFSEPALLISPAKRIMSLQDPTRKMSKSDPDVMSRILVTDSPKIIQEKLRKAKTDSNMELSYDPVKRPGVSNLIDILKHVTRSELSEKEIAADCKNMRLLNFKMMIADAVIKELDGVGEKFDELMVKDDHLKSKMLVGCERARKKAAACMSEVRRAVGLDYPVMPGSFKSASR